MCPEYFVTYVSGRKKKAEWLQRSQSAFLFIPIAIKFPKRLFLKKNRRAIQKSVD